MGIWDQNGEWSILWGEIPRSKQLLNAFAFSRDLFSRDLSLNLFRDYVAAAWMLCSRKALLLHSEIALVCIQVAFRRAASGIRTEASYCVPVTHVLLL